MRRAFFLVLCLVLGLPLIASAQKNVQPAPAGQAVFYQDYQCTTGNSIALGMGSYADLRSYSMEGGGNWNDQISCMTIGDGIKKVTVYQDINFKGKSKEFKKTANNPLGCWSLAKDWWNDRISSIKIE